MLCGLRDSNPKFWDELTKKEFDAVVPPVDVPQPEDTLPEDSGIDDSDVPIQSVINNIICQGTLSRYTLFTVYILLSFCFAYISICYCLATTLL
jgi:hypothetical protein